MHNLIANGFIGEFFGTMILLVLGIGIGAASNLKHSAAKGTNWHFITMTWGLAITFAVYVAGSLGSKGHLNPAVTLSFAFFHVDGFTWNQVPSYLIAQFLGAFVGAAIIAIHYYPHFKATKTEEEGNHVGIFTTGPAISHPLFNFLSEVIATTIFVFILGHLGNFTTGLKPLILGLLIMVIGQSFGETTGFAINPARDWAPRFAYTILPIPNKSSAHWEYAWVPMFGPLLGAFIACGLNTIIK
ncbi:MIP/aquaporin family protein [Lactobacillus psittaci]|uniref:Glycerol uptake facilitator protein n=1 Tax=Lactobacillus psittaci DSM 15354 TaxID=1122152 RepID=A0A0R1SA65_9LACO|nr:MIP/aquaporin family protein [Lactobacillus psittaci]KRL63285.1 glycerol uptake facilitator protein [Lactobacillus psittaci DSM 15354]